MERKERQAVDPPRNITRGMRIDSPPCWQSDEDYHETLAIFRQSTPLIDARKEEETKRGSRIGVRSRVRVGVRREQNASTAQRQAKPTTASRSRVNAVSVATSADPRE